MASNGRSRRQAASTSLSPSPCPSPPPPPPGAAVPVLVEQREALRSPASAAAPALPASAAASALVLPSPAPLQSTAAEPAARREKRQRRHGQQDSQSGQTGRSQAAVSGGQQQAEQQPQHGAERQAECESELKPEEAKEREEKSQQHPPPSAQQADGVAESRRRRRKRKEGESEEVAATTPASTSTSPVSQQQPSSAPLFRPEDLQCVICLDLPAGRDALQIFQCINGHLLCQPCFHKVVDSQRTVCPTCRVFLNRDRPIRCRFAETVLAALPTACGNAEAGCRLHIPFGQLAEHQSSHCLHRTTQCKYHALGCDWTGLAKDVRRHARGCETKTLDVKAILRGVKRRNEETERARQAERLQHRQAANVTAYLSKRARDIAIRDVTIEYDPITKERCANTFVACGKAWQLFLDPIAFAPQPTAAPPTGSASASAPASSSSSPSSSSTSSSSVPSLASSSLVSPSPSSAGSAAVSLHINCISPLSRRLIVIFIVLPGPLLELPLPPTITKVTYTRHATESEQFRLRVDEAHARQLYALDSVNMRIAVIDCSRGKMKRGFGGVEAEDDSVSEESEEDSTGDEEGGDGRRRAGGVGGAAAAAAAATLMRAARSRLPDRDEFELGSLDDDDDYVDGEDDELDDDFMDDDLHDSDCDCDCDDDDDDDEQQADDEEAELAAAISGVSSSGLQQLGRGGGSMEGEDASTDGDMADYARDSAAAARRRRL